MGILKRFTLCTVHKKMVLAIKVNVSLSVSETLKLDSDVTWNGFIGELVQEFAVPEELLKLYNISDVERENDLNVSDTDKEKKLIEIGGLQDNGQYEFDLELPSAVASLQTKIKILSGKCSIIAYKEEVFELD